MVRFASPLLLRLLAGLGSALRSLLGLGFLGTEFCAGLGGRPRSFTVLGFRSRLLRGFLGAELCVGLGSGHRGLNRLGFRSRFRRGFCSTTHCARLRRGFWGQRRWRGGWRGCDGLLAPLGMRWWWRGGRFPALFPGMGCRGFGYRFLPLLGERCGWGRRRFLDSGQRAHLFHELRVGFDFPVELQGEDLGNDTVEFRARRNPQSLQIRARQAGLNLGKFEQKTLNTVLYFGVL